MGAGRPDGFAGSSLRLLDLGLDGRAAGSELGDGLSQALLVASRAPRLCVAQTAGRAGGERRAGGECHLDVR